MEQILIPKITLTRSLKYSIPYFVSAITRILNSGGVIAGGFPAYVVYYYLTCNKYIPTTSVEFSDIDAFFKATETNSHIANALKGCMKVKVTTQTYNLNIPDREFNSSHYALKVSEHLTVPLNVIISKVSPLQFITKFDFTAARIILNKETKTHYQFEAHHSDLQDLLNKRLKLTQDYKPRDAAAFLRRIKKYTDIKGFTIPNVQEFNRFLAFFDMEKDAVLAKDFLYNLHSPTILRHDPVREYALSLYHLFYHKEKTVSF